MWHCHAIVERLTRSEASPHTVSSLGAVPSVIAVVAMPAAVITAVAMHLYSVAE
jgi:hypothetical protein